MFSYFSFPVNYIHSFAVAIFATLQCRQLLKHVLLIFIQFYLSFSGLIWSEIKQLWDVGLRDYVADMWNVVDFVTNSLYVATVALRLVAWHKVSKNLHNYLNLYLCPSFCHPRANFLYLLISCDFSNIQLITTV